MISLQARLRLFLLLGTLLLAACGSDDATEPDDAEAGQSVTTQPESTYTAAPSPLITPDADNKPASGGSAADLPPVSTSMPADAPNRVSVTIRDPLPVSAATLIDPQGNRIEAARINRDRRAYGGRGAGWPRIGVGVMGGSNGGISTGFGIGFPLLPQTTEAAGSIYESRFSFLLPDAAAYAANWQRWKIHIDLSDGVNSRSFETLPPAPPSR